MEVIFTPAAFAHLQAWKKSGNKVIQNRIIDLINSIGETPFEGIGKPEPLKHKLSGKWSRRINKEHRVVYMVNDDSVIIYSLRGHY